MRSSVWIASGFAFGQVIRLLSNLILTRFLAPEAFGLVALVTVVLVGLTLFSDVGIGSAIQTSKRGDDQNFLDVAWTIQVVRGVLLFSLCWALSYPLAAFYGEPTLAQLLPVAGLSLLISGFNPTRIDSATRHLMMGRVVIIEVVHQLLHVIVLVALSWAMGSVWALVIGGVIATVFRLLLANSFLPGASNRFRWEPEAGHELIHFGKWIFLSTICSFMINQGDKAILGKYLSLDLLGIYNLGFVLGYFPLMLAFNVVLRILVPLYRAKPPSESPENFRQLRLMRFALSSCLLTAQLSVAFLGVYLVDLLYDPRFQLAGPIVVAVACAYLPHLISSTYEFVSLSAGDSKRTFYLAATRVLIQIPILLIGVHYYGLVGAIASQALALMIVYVAIVWFARHYGAWDPLHDAVFMVIGAIGAALALWLNQDALRALVAASLPT